MNLHDLTIKKFHDGLLGKEFTAAEITKAYFERIESRDPEIGAYLSLMKENAFLEAEKTDIKVAKNETITIISQIPIANSSMLVLPKNTVPSFFSFWMTVASYAAR